MTTAMSTSRGIIAALLTGYGVALLAVWEWGRGAFRGPAEPLATPGWGSVWLLAALAVVLVAWLGLMTGSHAPLLAAVVTLGWVSPLLAATPGMAAPLRSACLALAPLLPPAVAALAASPAPTSPTGRRLVRSAAGLTGAAVLVRLLAYDPLLDPSCLRYCVPIGHRTPFPAGLTGVRVTIAILVTAALLALVVAVAHRPQSRSGVVWAATAAGAVALLPWWIAPSSVLPGPDDTSALAVAIGSSSALLTLLTMLRRRRAATLLLTTLDAAAAGVPIAGSHPGAVPDTPALRLALENARLRAEAADQVVALRDSRQRVVAAFDAERRRLGRDLHDTVQQRVVGALIQTRIALDDETDAGRREGLLEVIDLLTALLPRLRGLTERTAPELVDSDGLCAALEQRVAEVPGWRFRAEQSVDPPPGSPAARAAYIVVDSLLESAANEKPGELTLALGPETIRIMLRGPDLPVTDVLVDRIAVADGTVTRTQDIDADSVEVVLPCGS